MKSLKSDPLSVFDAHTPSYLTSLTMRETRLFDYAVPSEAATFPNYDITVPIFNHPATFIPGSWSSLVQETLSWRVEDGCTIIFENILTHKGFSLNFSSPLTCRPLFVIDAQSVFLITACHGSRSSCTLLRIRIDPSFGDTSAAPCEELGRKAISTSSVTAISKVDDDIIVGLSDGRAAELRVSPQLPTAIGLLTFAPLPSSKVDNTEQGENTSMVSRESSDSASSNRSMASSMSFGLMNRLFGSPRGTAVNRMPGASVDHSHIQMSSHFHESLRSRNIPGDGVVAVTQVKHDMKTIFTLHQSGRICMFTFQNGHYQFLADTVLPVKLSAAKVDHFLLMGQNASAIAVVIVDEDPSADSLRVYNITSKIRQNRSTTLSCTLIAKRDGPVGRVVSAVFTGDDVIVGTDSGALSGLLNVSNDIDSGAGIPSGTIWTAMDDVAKPFGLGRTIDEVSASYRGPLIIAHRFSSYVVAKALRNPDPVAATRDEVLAAVTALEFPDDEENMWKRVRVRAEQITKLEDMKVRDVSVIEGIGILVARQTSVYILRGLFESERKAFGNCSQLLNDRGSCVKGLSARLLSSHAVTQVLASQYHVGNVTGATNRKVPFMLTMCIKFSENNAGVALSDILLGGFASGRPKSAEFPDLRAAITNAISILEPGSKLLTSLLRSSELEPLTLAAEQAADALPISAMFASGVAWLGMYRKESSQSSVGTDVDGPQEEALMQEDERLNTMLEKAYGFLVAAAQWCDKEEADSDEDAQCAIGLAGLSSLNRRSMDQGAVDANAMITDSPTTSYSSLLPNGPNEKLARAHLGFWLLERAVRLLESSGAPKSAAAAALEAMERAPDRKRHEMMRAAAFSRFLDAGELEHALTAILSAPFSGDDDIPALSEESAALRDAFGLLVNAVADRGMLQWLANYDLPEPLRVLCGQALERRARAADPLQIGDHMLRNIRIFNHLSEDEDEQHEEERPTTDYEMLYSWHTLRDDRSSAATMSLEWAERLSREGQGLVHRAINGKPPILASDQQIRLMLIWIRTKQEALALTSAASRLQPVQERYVARSRFSLLIDEPRRKSGAIVDVAWVLRRQLLAHAQSKCLTIYLSQCENGEAPDVRHLMGPGSPFLEETREGVAWAVSMLSNHTSYENMSLAVELCRAWDDEIGDEPLRNAVCLAAQNASRCSVKEFDYSDLDNVLRGLISSLDPKRSKRNWYFIAFESALGMLGGSHTCPQWLIDAAAWGTVPFGDGTPSSHRQFYGRVGGDATAVVRAFLRYNRPTDAARVLLSGLAAQEKGTQASFYVPYAAIDATLEILSQLSDAFPDAEMYHEKLLERTKAHIARMEKLSKEAVDNINAMEHVNGQNGSAENDMGVYEIAA